MLLSPAKAKDFVNGGRFFGFSPALNLLHLVQAGVLGVPGVILMVVLHFTL